jgi:conjugal transfer pilus assembly protein TraV
MSPRRSSALLGVAIACTSVLSGCAISGLDGGSKYACKAPEGVHCDSVSGTYYNAIQNNLPSQRSSSMSQRDTAAPKRSDLPTRASAMLTTSTPASGDTGAFEAAPLRATPKVLRLWVKSWEDADRDLNGESLVYVQVDNGRWLIDYVQRQNREAFAPVRVPRAMTGASGVSSDPKEADAAPAVDPQSAITRALQAVQGRGTTPAGGSN